MNENPYMNEESRSAATGMSGFLLGAIVGAGVALLFAPAAGTDTRRKLGDTAKRLGSAARDKVQEGRDQLQDRFGSSGDRDRQGSSTSPTSGQGFESGRREPVPSTGSTTNPGQTGRTGATPGRTNP